MRPLSWLIAMILAAMFLAVGTKDVVVVETTITQAPPAKTEPAYRGNTKTYKFHKRACRYYSCTNCTAEFNTREDAIAAGYRPCGTCDP